MNKEQWIEEAYGLLCKSQGAPLNATQENNLREWAVMIYEQARKDADEVGCQIMSPKEAHDEELSCA